MVAKEGKRQTKFREQKDCVELLGKQMSGAKGWKNTKKEEQRGEVATGRRVLIRLSDHSAITASVVDTSNNLGLFKMVLNFIKTQTRDKD